MIFSISHLQCMFYDIFIATSFPSIRFSAIAFTVEVVYFTYWSRNFCFHKEIKALHYVRLAAFNNKATYIKIRGRLTCCGCIYTIASITALNNKWDCLCWWLAGCFKQLPRRWVSYNFHAHLPRNGDQLV